VPLQHVDEPSMPENFQRVTTVYSCQIVWVPGQRYGVGMCIMRIYTYMYIYVHVYIYTYI